MLPPPFCLHILRDIALSLKNPKMSEGRVNKSFDSTLMDMSRVLKFWILMFASYMYSNNPSFSIIRELVATW